MTATAARPQISDCHRAFGHLLRNFAARVRDRRPAWLGYRAEAIAARLAQRLAAMTMMPFRRAYAAEPDAAARGRAPISGPVRFEADAAWPRIAPRLVARFLLAFAFQWLQAAVAATASLRLRSAPGSPGVLAYGIPAETIARGADDADFADFCRRGPVAPFREAARIFVQFRGERASTDPRIRYGADPLLMLLRTGLGPAALARFWSGHLRAAFSFLRAVAALPFACTLARDFAQHAAAAAADRAGLLHGVLTTGSNYIDQALWMSDLPSRRFRSHMVFYSINAHPFASAACPRPAFNPAFSLMRADDFWVWTEGQAAMVAEWGIAAATHVCGPILFYLPKSDPAVDGRPRIALFDITPFRRGSRDERLAGTYYSPATATAFLEDVVATRDRVAADLGIAIEIRLKPKRATGPAHDPEYLALVRRLADDPQGIAVDTSGADLYALISAATVVIAPPYSSPVHLAAHLGVPGIYYDPTRELLPNHETRDGIHFAGGVEELHRLLAGMFSARPPVTIPPSAADHDPARTTTACPP